MFRRLAFVIGLVAFSQTAMAAMILSFESSLQSWVGQGESHTVSPSDGFIFSGGEYRSFDNSLDFRVASLSSPFGPDWEPLTYDSYYYWSLRLAAPFDQLLGVGLYENAARYPFQDDDQPGLTFSGNHRGNNRNAGFFEIHEIAFDNVGNIDSIAVDFTQYGETNPDWWINGEFRFNSTIPLSYVPEPGVAFLMLTGLGMLLIFYRQKST